jgi:hypothetical protein
MIAALLLGLLFIAAAAAFFFFLLHILYPSLYQQGFPVDDPFVKPWPVPRQERDAAASPLMFNTSADCLVVRSLQGGEAGRKAVVKCYETCVEVCPRMELGDTCAGASIPSRCVYAQEFEEKQSRYYRIFLGYLLTAWRKFRRRA